MIESFKIYAGIDVSKSWLDVAVYHSEDSKIVYHARIDNTKKSIGLFLKELKKELNFNLEEILFIQEHTGKYGECFLNCSIKFHLKVWVETPLQIKRSMGLVRGKTDRWDAERIAMYGYRFRDKAVLWKPVDQTLLELKSLQSKRNLLVKSHRQLSQENKNDVDFKAPLSAIKKSIASIERKIESLILAHESYKSQYEILQSVPGIGMQTATALIITTHGFTRLTESRQLSCYAGVAPFAYSSGSSIRGRTKVSKLGDMKLKSLLNLSAWNAIRSIPTFKEYYAKKVASGKHKLSVINAIRNKLIALALAVIKRNSPYIKDFCAINLDLP